MLSEVETSTAIEEQLIFQTINDTSLPLVLVVIAKGVACVSSPQADWYPGCPINVTSCGDVVNVLPIPVIHAERISVHYTFHMGRRNRTNLSPAAMID